MRATAISGRASSGGQPSPRDGRFTCVRLRGSRVKLVRYLSSERRTMDLDVPG